MCILVVENVENLQRPNQIFATFAKNRRLYGLASGQNNYLSGSDVRATIFGGNLMIKQILAEEV